VFLWILRLVKAVRSTGLRLIGRTNDGLGKQGLARPSRQVALGDALDEIGDDVGVEGLSDRCFVNLRIDGFCAFHGMAQTAGQLK